MAERLKDTRELARILNNLGDCEIRLGNLDAAIGYLRAALAAFERENMLGERQRVFWGMARLLRDHGRLNDAATELLRVRTNFQARGMIIDAALAGLDLVELLAATDPASVAAVCRDLVTVFRTVGREQNMRVALAYLAEQARLDARVDAPVAFQTELRYVRGYFKELAVAPDAVFAPPTPAPH
jgi:tetratricopeptide (TPR) repeat protein